MALPTALYALSSDHFGATALTAGPWEPGAQHGGPPSALLAGAVERFGDEAEAFFVARVAVDLLRPVPVAPLEVNVQPIRLGHRAQWLLASLRCAGQTVARANCLRIRTSELELPPGHTPERTPPRAPDAIAESFEFPFFSADVAYHRAVELRIARGTWSKGPVFLWFRLRYPLVEGRPTSALERTMVIADAANGASPVLDPHDFVFLNPELTVHLRRPARGDWIGLEARSTPEPTGVGLVQAELFDTDGAFGTCLQSLLIQPRPAAGARSAAPPDGAEAG